MAPSSSFSHLYRICKNQELWSRCTIKQVERFTSNWDNVCPKSSAVNETSTTKTWDEHIFLWREYILFGCFIAIVLDLAYCGVLVYNWKKRGTYKPSECKDKEMIAGVAYNKDLTEGVSSFSTSSSVVFLDNSFEKRSED